MWMFISSDNMISWCVSCQYWQYVSVHVILVLFVYEFYCVYIAFLLFSAICGLGFVLIAQLGTGLFIFVCVQKKVQFLYLYLLSCGLHQSMQLSVLLHHLEVCIKILCGGFLLETRFGLTLNHTDS